MKITVDELTKVLTPMSAAQRKTFLSLDGVEVTDADGQPVDIKTIELATMDPVAENAAEANGEATDAAKASDDPEADPEAKAAADATKALAVQETAIKRLVADALAVQRKAAPAPRRPISANPHQGEKFVMPANVKRYGNLKNFKGDRHGKGAEERAYRFGQWVLATVSRQLPGRYNFKASQDFVDNHIVKLASTNVNTAGGFQVPEEFGTDLIDLREQYGVARRLLKVVPMASDTRTDPRRDAGLTAYFVNEGGAGTESTKTWGQVRLVAKDLMVLTRYTNQLSDDAVINIGDDIAGEIAYAFANKEDLCAFNGDGTSTYGTLVGIRTKLDSIDGAGTDSAGLVAQGNSTGWSNVALSDFNNVVGKLPQYADTPNACWVAHRTFYFSIMQKLELAAGGVSANEVREGNRKPRPMFLGYPVEFSQVYPAVTGSAQVACTFGDHALGASFGDRQQDAIAFSEHASIGGQSVFERNEIAVRGTERFDVNVHDVGDATNPGPIVGLKVA